MSDDSKKNVKDFKKRLTSLIAYLGLASTALNRETDLIGQYGDLADIQIETRKKQAEETTSNSSVASGGSLPPIKTKNGYVLKTQNGETFVISSSKKDDDSDENSSSDGSVPQPS